MRGGWTERLKSFFDKKTLSDPGSNFNCSVYNLGVDGNTAEEILKRFEFETKQRIEEEKETIFIFATGVNDSCFVQSRNTLLVLPEKFKENIQKLINLAQKFSSKIIFVGLTPVDETKVNPFPYSTSRKSYKNESIEKYNEIIKLVCKENKIDFLEIFEKWIKIDYKGLLEDGLHPNSKGHEKIFEVVKNFLIENKII